jgi:O-antigen/teichoic acid export membrane protein
MVALFLSVAIAKEPTTTTGDLRSRMLRGSVFELGGYGAQTVLRLASNLILTRLLFPAAFGLMSVLGTLMTGLVLLTDVAIQPCVIQSKRGDEPAFLNTAFTIQAMRGAILAAVMVVLAKPAAWFYREPQLETLIYVGSLQLLIGGLHSTSVFTLRRSLRLGWVNALELTQTVVGMTVMIVAARAWPSVWSLIIGTLAGSLVFTLVSHLLPVAYRNRFHWDKEASQEISKFGRWVLGSSTAQFLGGQSDRILMGRLVSVAWLGVYAVALTLSEAAGAVVNRLVSGVMYPVLSQAGREADGKIADLYYRLRLRLDAFSMTATGFLAGLGTWIIAALWDSRYVDAGWILRILCVRVAVQLIVGPGETCLFSLGHTRFGFKRSVVRLVGATVCIPLGWWLGGIKGLVWGAVITEMLTVFAVWPKLIELKILRIQRELLAILLFVAALGLGAALALVLPELHLRR